ncbi:hypothetical protein [Lacticaseibacillus zhaodongensis]|uniref:hypothetical protein n=1 Tax=Lacticaseibacillus zhaodongensis TaxID=2668065 RepID=UPI0012D35949|nr:hypothetical protein [Lacticaseibacillus zhaodongensis]
MQITSLVMDMLHYLQERPASYTLGRDMYQNEVTFFVSDNIIFPGHKELFPENRLHATRLAATFKTDAPDLVRWLAKLISPDKAIPEPKEIWFTGSYMPQMHHWLIQISFE